jgi:hypothetical protein
LRCHGVTEPTLTPDPSPRLESSRRSVLGLVARFYLGSQITTYRPN